MSEQQDHNLFSELVARHQCELYAYIFAIVRNWEDTDNLFQSVCPGSLAQVRLVPAGRQLLFVGAANGETRSASFLRRNRRKLYASDQVLNVLAETPIDSRSDEAEIYLAALRRCKAKLTAADEELLDLCYVEDLGSLQIADRLHRSQQSVCNSLRRIRRWMLECIQRELARQDAPAASTHE